MSPAKPVSGVTVIVPSAATVTVPFGTGIVCAVPCVIATPLTSITDRTPLFGSLSFASRSISTGVAGCVWSKSSTATGGAFGTSTV